MKRLMICLVIASSNAVAQMTISPPNILFEDGTVQSTAAVVYTRIVVVPADGTDTEDGSALSGALASITTAAANNRFLIQLEPGTYDLGGFPLFMRPYVDIQGSGMTSTTITSTASKTVQAIFLSSRVGIRSLEVRNTSASTYGSCVDAYGSLLEFHRVRLTASGSGVYVTGLVLMDLDDGSRVKADVSSGDGSEFPVSIQVGVSERQARAMVSSDVLVNNCIISVSGGSTGSAEGILVRGASRLETAFLQIVNSSATSGDRKGITMQGTSTALLQFTSALVTSAGGSTNDGLSLNNGSTYVETYYSFFGGAVAFHGSGGTSKHVATGFRGLRGGFTNGLNAWFAHCYDYSNNMPVPLINTLAAIAP